MWVPFEVQFPEPPGWVEEGLHPARMSLGFWRQFLSANQFADGRGDLKLILFRSNLASFAAQGQHQTCQG